MIMKTPTFEQIKSITNQLDRIKCKLGTAKNEEEEKSLLKQNDILVKKRLELRKQLSLADPEIINIEK